MTIIDFQSQIAGSLRLSNSSLLYLVLLAYSVFGLSCFEIDGVLS